MEKKKWYSWERVAIFLYLLFLAFLYTVQSVSFLASARLIHSDGSVYQYLGHLITIGKMPYRDAFDHKGPLLYLINAVSCLVGIYRGTWVVDLSFMIATVFVMYRTVRKYLDPLFTLIVMTVVLTDFTHSYWIGDTPDFYALLFNAVALYILSGFFDKGTLSYKDTFIIGVATACIFWLKLNSIIGVLTVCFFIIMKEILNKKYIPALKYLGGFLLGAFAISAILSVWLLVTNSFGDMIEDYFKFNLFYVDTEGSRLNYAITFWEFITLPTSLFCIAMFLLFLIMRYLKQEQIGTEGRFLLYVFIAYLSILLSVSLTGRQYRHYLSFTPAYIVIVAAIALRELQKSELKYKTIIEMMGVYIAFSAIVYPGIQSIRSNCGIFWTPHWEDEAVIGSIKDICSGDDTIAVMTPDECGYYLFSGFESATTYPYIQAAMYDNADFRNHYIEQLQTNAPMALVWKKNRNIDDFFSVKPEVLQLYELASETDNYQVYALRK